MRSVNALNHFLHPADVMDAGNGHSILLDGGQQVEHQLLVAPMVFIGQGIPLGNLNGLPMMRLGRIENWPLEIHDVGQARARR